MYTTLRLIKKILFKIWYIGASLFILKTYLEFKHRDKKNRFENHFFSSKPVLFENTPYTRFDTHYIYHTAWAARKVKEIGAVEHVDISSSLYFSSIVSAFIPVRFYDYRPAMLNLANLHSASNDLTKLSFADSSISSLSCMHTLEHVGLGRYGDPIDPDGDLRAAAELERVVAKGGSLLFVVPVGKSVIEFNSHRIYSYQMVIDMFPNLRLKEFSLIPDNALEKGIVYNATKEQSDMQKYGCGCFWFVND